MVRKGQTKLFTELFKLETFKQHLIVDHQYGGTYNRQKTPSGY